MDMSPSAQRKLAGTSQRARVEDLLRTYPNTAAEGRAEILTFLKKGPALDVGLITANHALRLQLQQFRADHAAELSLGSKEYLGALLIVAIYLGVCALLWDAGIR